MHPLACSLISNKIVIKSVHKLVHQKAHCAGVQKLNYLELEVKNVQMMKFYIHLCTKLCMCTYCMYIAKHKSNSKTIFLGVQIKVQVLVAKWVPWELN